MTDVRYSIFPQMKHYDAMASGKVVPFAMLAGPMDYKSEFINTDQHGFRYSKFKGDMISVDDISKLKKVNILIGGSTVFGVGSTSDEHTISSMLSEDMDAPWLNMGIRGGVSLQEYIHLIRFLYKAENVNNIVFFSGVNDAYVNLVKDKYDGFDQRFENDDWKYSCKRKFISWLASKLYLMNSEDLIDLPVREILLYPFGKKEKVDKCTDFKDGCEVMLDNYKRNFSLYSALKKEFGAKIYYVLQPYAPWTGKVLSNSEKKVFQNLDDLQKGTKWHECRKGLDEKLYLAMNQKLATYGEEFDIHFCDSNPYFAVTETAFVDGVHLNDYGNKLAKEVIINCINKGA